MRSAWVSRIRSAVPISASRVCPSPFPASTRRGTIEIPPPAVTFGYGRISTGRGLTAAAASPGRSPAVRRPPTNATRVSRSARDEVLRIGHLPLPSEPPPPPPDRRTDPPHGDLGHESDGHEPHEPRPEIGGDAGTPPVDRERLLGIAQGSPAGH